MLQSDKPNNRHLGGNQSSVRTSAAIGMTASRSVFKEQRAKAVVRPVETWQSVTEDAVGVDSLTRNQCREKALLTTMLRQTGGRGWRGNSRCSHLGSA